MNPAREDDTLYLGSEPDAVPRARRWAIEAVEGHPVAELAPDVELVVSELVTNALLHAGPPAWLRVFVAAERVRIEVGDGSRRAPLRALARPEAMTGRGLSLVSALSREWGVEPLPTGKVVWCELTLGPVEVPEDVDVDALLAAWDDHMPDTLPHYTVELGDVPTDLLLAAKAHVDNVVREFTLAVAGAATGRGSPVPPHLAALVGDVVTGFAEARQSIKRQALDAAARGDDRTRLVLSLPLDAADAGARYLQALDEADAYARAARLLTLESPPQHQVFRRWYVEEIVSQLRAVAVGEEPPPPMTFERRLLREIRVVTTARRAAEHAARMQAVTAALAAATTVEDVGSAVVREAVETLDAFGGALLVPGAEHRIDIRASIGYDDALVDRLHRETLDAPLPSAYSLRTGEPVWLESPYERDEQYPALRGLDPSAVAMCVVPLVARGEVSGALRFSFDRPKLFDADERRFVETLAAQTAQALDRTSVIAKLADANAKLAFLAEASAELAASLDYRTTLRNVARLAVPRLADWCAIHLIEDGRIPVIAVAHIDPEKVALAEDLSRRYPVDPGASHGIANVVRTRRGEIMPAITDDFFVAAARDEEHLRAMRALGLRSALIVPLASHDRVLGTLSMFHSESGRTYTDDDLALAEDLARRGAMAIEHATLFRTLSE